MGINFRNLGEIGGILVKNEAEIGVNFGDFSQKWGNLEEIWGIWVKNGEIWGEFEECGAIWGEIGQKMGKKWGKSGGFGSKMGENRGEFEGFWTTMTKISGILVQNGEKLG